ncbi:MAG: cell division protein SepF [Streptococcus sp.]|nr:cell division protein SepF [Streptococcus sp.]
MSIKDRFDKFIDYFTEDGDETDVQTRTAPTSTGVAKQQQVDVTPTPSARSSQSERFGTASSSASQKSSTENITRLHARQQELAQQRANADEKITIDVRYPKKYEEATEIVDLLLANESILIDFQYMTEVQARRCLDYLDGARYVLAGNLKKVASTMYLLTPINVIVNVEDIRLPNDTELSEFDFDMKRNR